MVATFNTTGGHHAAVPACFEHSLVEVALDDECDAPDGGEKEEHAPVHAAQVESLVLHHPAAREGAHQEAQVADSELRKMPGIPRCGVVTRLCDHARHVGCSSDRKGPLSAQLGFFLGSKKYSGGLTSQAFPVPGRQSVGAFTKQPPPKMRCALTTGGVKVGIERKGIHIT